MADSKYKRISLYNAETKKSSGVTITKANFASPEEMDAYCQKIKAENRHRNKLYREQAAAERIRGVIEREIGVVEVPTQLPAKMTHIEGLDIELDPGTGSSFVIYGASKRGKTTLMMHIYKKYFATPHKINTLFSGNPQLKAYKQDHNLLISYGFNANSAKYIQLQQYVNVNTNNRYQFTDLFDDIVDQKYAPIVNKLVLTYRNSNISSIICLQYVFLLSKQNRSSVNHTAVFGANTAEDTKNIIDAVLKPFLVELGLRQYGEQVEFYKAATTNHGFIYIDNVNGRMSVHRLAL